MIRRLLLFVFLIGFSSSIYSVSANFLQRHFEEGVAQEKIGAYQRARQSYAKTVKYFLNSTPLEERTSAHHVVVVAAAYRLSMVTAKTVYTELQPVLTEHDYFKQTHEFLNELIYYFSYEVPSFSPAQNLYFSRGYNRVMWANRLLQAVAWKQFILYPQADLVHMAEEGARDIQIALQITSVPLVFKGVEHDRVFFQTESSWLSILQGYGIASNELLTYQRMMLQEDDVVLAHRLAYRDIEQAGAFIRYWRGLNVQHALKRAATRYTFEDIVSSQNKPVFVVFQTAVNLLD